MPFDFPFEQLDGRFTAPILNEVGSDDLWPALAQSITWGYGSSGTYGFRSPGVADRWHKKTDHSQFFTEEFCKQFWLPFFSDGTINSGDAPVLPRWWVRLISQIKLKYVIPLGAGAVVWLVTPDLMGYFQSRVWQLIRNPILVTTTKTWTPQDFRVTVWFDGSYSREKEIVPMAVKLSTIGWNIGNYRDPASRTDKAKNRNEVRYSADGDAAEALAKALKTEIETAKPIITIRDPAIAAKSLEIWIYR